MTRPSLVRLASAMLLRIYPRDVRARFGDELPRAFEEAWREEKRTRGAIGRALLMARLAANAVTSAFAFHLRVRRPLRVEPASARVRGASMTAFIFDVRLAIRGLLRAPSFTATSVFILALGIGAMTASMTLVHHVLLSPLPYPEPHRLVMVWDVLRSDPGEHHVVSPGNVFDWREQSTTLESLAVFNLATLPLDVEDGRERVPGAVVSGNYFDVLGVPPQLGRALAEADDEPGAPPAVVLSHGFWTQRFGADPEVLGRPLRVGTATITVVGIMPPGFRGPDEHYFGRADFWLPMRMQRATANRGGRYLRTVARLKPGVTVEQAQSDIRTIADRLSVEYPATNKERAAVVVPLHDALVAGVKPTLLMLLAAVAMVHLTVCANLANLLLSRGVARQREYAIRAAIGASRGRIIQAVSSEGLALAIGGAAAGILVAGWVLAAAATLVPDLPRIESIRLDGWAVGFALLLALATTVFFSIVPALSAAGIQPWRALQSARHGAGQSHPRLRRVLVVAEIAVSVMLLVAAVLLARSFARLASTPSGFSSAGVLTARVDLPNVTEGQPEANRGAAHALASHIGSLPGVQHAGFTTSLPLFGLNNMGLGMETRTRRDGDRKLEARYRAVTPGYLRAIQLELLAGRLLDESDQADGPGAVVINDVAARSYGGEDPIGAPIRIDFGGQLFQGVVVGVVAGVRHENLAVTPDAEVYVPYAQHPVMRTLFLAAQGASPLPTAGALREAVRTQSPRATLDQVAPLQELVDRSIAGQRLSALLLTALSGVALALAIVGLYAVIAYSVAQRIREFGIRLALGARGSQILTPVLGDGLILAVIGVAIGSVLAYLAGGLLQGMLYGIDADDKVTFVAVAAVMVGVAAAASYLPARQACRVDPIILLRME